MSTRQREQTADWAKGRWPAILIELGIDPSYIKDEHGPCPICEGKDRFRFDDKEARGTYFCSGCGPGDGFDLLQKFHGWDFGTTAKAIDELRGNDVPRETFKPAVDYERRRIRLNEMWGDSKDKFVVPQYLKFRGLGPSVEMVGRNVRGHAGLAMYKDSKVVGYHPAMVALVKNPNGMPVSLHRTYLIPNEKQKKLMPSLEGLAGAAVRLIPGAEALVVGEGIETTLAGWEWVRGTGVNGPLGAWACISANGLKTVKLPNTVKQVYICMDNDFSYTGQAAAYELARVLTAQKEKPRVTVMEPTMKGCDIMDVFTQANCIEAK